MSSLIARGAETIDRIVAVVGTEPILQSDLNKMISEVKFSKTLANIYQVNPASFGTKDALEKIIEDKIIKMALREFDASVTDAEIDQQISTIAKTNKLTLSQLENSLSREGISFMTYKKNIRKNLEKRVIFDRELRRGTGISEIESRSIYDSKAKTEFLVDALVDKNLKKLEHIQTESISKKLTSKEISENYGFESLGWIQSDGLDPKISKVLSNNVVGSLSGPFKNGKSFQLILLREVRKGSDEDFERNKSEIVLEAQAQDIEKRFQSWIERKKKDYQILYNGL
jgi:peptidyl-prolyl cis-trans isomerase SurA